MDRLTAEDRLILWPDGIWPQDIGAVGLLDGSGLFDPDGGFRIEAVRAAIAARLHLLPRFRQVLHTPRRGLGGPLWVDAPRFDLRDHVQVAQVSAPGDEADLLRTVERLRRRRLDRSRPLWEMWFLTGLAEGRVGWFVRLHHVVADGVAGVASFEVLLDPSPDAGVVPGRPWIPAPWPRARDLLVDNVRRRSARLRHAAAVVTRPAAALRRIRDAWPATRELLAEKPGPRTSLDRVIGRDRNLALVRSSLGLVKAAAQAHGATVNDVLLTVVAGGLRGLLRSRGEPVAEVALPVFVPVSLRRPRPGRKQPGQQQPGRDAGNLISEMVVRLPLGMSDPGRRLRAIAAQTAVRKTRRRPSLGVMFHSRLARRAMLKLVVRQRVNVTTADLPGPHLPLYLAGARLLEVFPLVNLLGNQTLGVAALSYAGQFNILAVADRDACPDLDVFATGADAALGALFPVERFAPHGPDGSDCRWLTYDA